MSPSFGEKPFFKPPSTPTPSSRLKKNIGILATTVAMAGCAAPLAPLGAEHPRTADQAQLHEAEFQRDMKQLGEIIFSFEKLSLAMDRSIQDEATIRKAMLASELPHVVKRIVKNMDPKLKEDHFDHIGDLLSIVNCEGLLLQAYMQRFHHLPEHNSSRYFGVRAKDYLPLGADVTDEQIDPRVQKKDNAFAKLSITEYPAWTTPERKLAFRALLNDESVRRHITAADLTLSETFSLLKATIAHQERFKEKKSPEEVVQYLLKEREGFAKQRILGPDTETFIAFGGDDRYQQYVLEDQNRNNFYPKRWRTIAEAAHVPEKAIRVIDATESIPAEKVKDNLIRAIQTSKGRTVLAFDTHGERERLMISLGSVSEKSVELSVGELVDALASRATSSRNTDDLKNVTIILDSCYGYNFTRELEKDFQIAYNYVTHMPQVITIAHEGALGWIGHSMSDVLLTQVKGLEKDGGLYGQRLLEYVQPLVYRENDLTFFIPKGKELLEIGKRDAEMRHRKS